MTLLCKAPVTSKVLSRTTRGSFVSPGNSHLRRSAWRRVSTIGAKNSSRFLIECKKKKKGKAAKRSANVENEAMGSMKEYLELGMLLGDTADETISRVEERFVGLDMNKEAQEVKQMLEEKERKAKKMDDLMNKVMKGGLDLKDSDLGGEAPMWASNDKFDNAWDKMDLEISNEGGFGGFMSGEVDYLENEDDLPEDFSYEDFENMIAKLPDNLLDGTFSPPPPPSSRPGSSSRRGKTPKAVAPTPQLVNKPSTPQARNYDEFQDRLRDQSEHPDDFFGANFEVISESSPQASIPIKKPIPSLHKPGARLIQEEKKSDMEAEEAPSVDVVADFVVPEFKRSELKDWGEKEVGSKPVENRGASRKREVDLEVPEMRSPVRKIETEVVADRNASSTKPAPGPTPKITPSPTRVKKSAAKADPVDEKPTVVSEKRPQQTPPDQHSKKTDVEELSSTSMSNSEAVEDGVLSEGTDEGSIPVEDKVPELHKPAFAGPVQDSSPSEAPPKRQSRRRGQKRGKKTRPESVKKAPEKSDVEEVITDKKTDLPGKKAQVESEVNEPVAEKTPVDNRVLQEISFDESEPSDPVPKTAGKPEKPSKKVIDHLAFRAQAGRVNKLLISGEPVSVMVTKGIDGGVFVRGEFVFGFLPFSLLAAKRMRYLTFMASKMKDALKKEGKLKKGIARSKEARRATLANMAGTSLLAQVHRVDAQVGEVTFLEMGSTQATCPLAAWRILKESNVHKREITGEVLAVTEDATFLECRFDKLNYPITGILRTLLKGKQESAPEKEFKLGEAVQAKMLDKISGEHQLLLAQSVKRNVLFPKRQLLPGNLPEVERFCMLLKERPFFIQEAKPGALRRVSSSTPSFQVLMDTSKKSEATKEVVEMTLICRLENKTQEIKITTAHDKQVIKGIIESVMKKMYQK
ncbi:hypothetical protein BSKO_05596 [Bryopsis sp. KO-2023]|nr:hypothetical protein BSKO_05596 [Bryopsis sp. KO-2023]